MDWKAELSKALAHRKIINYSELYFQKTNEVIIPTLKDILEFLRDFNISSSIKGKSELQVDSCGFSMQIELNYDKVKMTYSYLDPLEPIKLPPYQESLTKEFALNEITCELVGNEFSEAFKPCLKMFYSGSQF